ncbi:hypothetical protein [Sphingomonas sp. DC1100-1]|uniref:hypothetical protein n=1 Tax=unclassified Sphingomonas TaxID=196159 RepID=UPI003CEF2E9E
MPTGYTADVADGSVTDLTTFAMRLARGMGATVTMRDDPMDKPIPEAFEPSRYHAERLEEAKAERDRLHALTDAETQAEAEAEHAEFLSDRANARDEHNACVLRYKAMIDKVEAWQGAPEGIKEFALDQLRSGMDFDCPREFRFYRQEPTTDGAEWMADKLAQIERDIEYHAKKDAEERARTDGRNAWIAQLRRSLATGDPA